MEKLKSVIPEALRREIAMSAPEQLPSVASALVEFLRSLPQFNQMVGELADRDKGLCGKNKEAALEFKQKANSLFSAEDYVQALSFYTQALRAAPADADHMGKNLLATLFLNRASTLYKLGLLKECVRDCNRSLKIFPTYSKAWYRRGQANASMGNYKDSINDFNVAKRVEPSLGGKKQIEAELNLYTERNRTAGNPLDQDDEKRLCILDEQHQKRLQCVTTLDKGRGMVSLCDIREASLIHTEDPYAMVILKECRESYCYYCLNELPMDKIPCKLCSIPLFCSENCQAHAGEQLCQNFLTIQDICEELPSSLEKHISDVTLSSDSCGNVEGIPEHQHECGGVNWLAVLPSEIVLAGRVLVKSIFQKKCYADISNLVEFMDLCHNYAQFTPERKLELHLYSSVLLHCLEKCCDIDIPISGLAVSQIVLLLSQIRVNSLAIVRMRSMDVQQKADLFGKSLSNEDALTANVEQVRVGQAIYKAASLFNHSCLPNIHAYFLSRTIFIRTTEFVPVGSFLELSYGPQVGQWDRKDRAKFLEEEYSFQCHCIACSKLNLSDLVMNAFCCVNPNCPGVILDSSAITSVKKQIHQLVTVDKLNFDELNRVACIEFKQSTGSLNIASGFCLKCGSSRDLVSSHTGVNKAWMHIEMLQDINGSGEISTTLLSDAFKSFGLLRSTLHSCNKSIAKAEDIFAQTFCLLGDLQQAMTHCKESIKILKELYGPNHIVVGYELVKLFSIQLLLRDSSAVDTSNQLNMIFYRYYGLHADTVFPYLQILNREARRLA